MGKETEILSDNNPLVINLFGGPGSGKSTIAAGIFYALKRMSINTELVTEYAKELVWEQHESLLSDQLSIFAKQHRCIDRLRSQVDVIVTDSPFIMGLVYDNGTYKHLPRLVQEAWDAFDNFNILVHRSTTYQEVGRRQSEEQAIDKDNAIRDLLSTYGIAYETIDPSAYHDASIHIVDTMIKQRLETY